MILTLSLWREMSTSRRISNEGKHAAGDKGAHDWHMVPPCHVAVRRFTLPVINIAIECFELFSMKTACREDRECQTSALTLPM